MNKKESIADNILEVLFDVGQDLLFLFPRPFETKYDWAYRLKKGQDRSYRKAVLRLQKKGCIEIVKKNGQKFLRITKAGELEALLMKARVIPMKNWDGKWRLCMFDIPEKHKRKRIFLRSLLLKNNFRKLQHSVYITPYELNGEAVQYLKETGLIDFIRLLRVDRMDDDRALKNKFKLK